MVAAPWLTMPPPAPAGPPFRPRRQVSRFQAARAPVSGGVAGDRHALHGRAAEPSASIPPPLPPAPPLPPGRRCHPDSGHRRSTDFAVARGVGGKRAVRDRQGAAGADDPSAATPPTHRYLHLLRSARTAVSATPAVTGVVARERAFDHRERAAGICDPASFAARAAGATVPPRLSASTWTAGAPGAGAVACEHRPLKCQVAGVVDGAAGTPGAAGAAGTASRDRADAEATAPRLLRRGCWSRPSRSASASRRSGSLLRWRPDRQHPRAARATFPKLLVPPVSVRSLIVTLAPGEILSRRSNRSDRAAIFVFVSPAPTIVSLVTVGAITNSPLSA